MKPGSGNMYWWRAKGGLEWRFGYCTHESGNLVRMGRWAGDTIGGSVLDPFDIEWKPYR